MRFTTWSTPTNAFIYSAVALTGGLMSLIPAANADAYNDTLLFSSPVGDSHVVAEQNYLVTWYVPRREAER
jgi:hypothetical protein